MIALINWIIQNPIAQAGAVVLFCAAMSAILAWAIVAEADDEWPS